MARDDKRPGIRPRPSLGRQLDIIARHSFPATSTVLLMLLCSLPFGISGQAALLPATTLAAVYFWSLFRPAALPPPIVFAIGLLLDLLGYLPIGAGVLTLLLLHGFARRARRSLTQAGFIAVWLAFLAAAACATALIWSLTSLLALHPMPPGPTLFLAVLAGALYPAIAALLTTAHRTIANPEHI
jgi:rod shape-determining protein MreD